MKTLVFAYLQLKFTDFHSNRKQTVQKY